MSSLFTRSALLISTMCLITTGCSSDNGNDDPDGGNEVITTITLAFTPVGGGDATLAGVNDPDGEGGAPPVVTGVKLLPGMYTMTVKIEDRLQTPTLDITPEIKEEGHEHQLFFFGTAVEGPASKQSGGALAHTYADSDSNGLPIGLSNNVTATAGMGNLTLVLRHLPPVNDKPVKVAGLAELVAAGGVASIAGSTDVEITLPVSVSTDP